MRFIAALIAALVFASCSESAAPSGDDDDVLPDVAEDVGEDVTADADDDATPDADPPSEPKISVQLVEDPALLPTGDGAEARLGKAWMIANDVARFYVQDTDVAAGINLYGGNLIDGVLLDGSGNPGPDRFREMFPIIRLKLATAETITVETAEDGEPFLRVRGTDLKTGVVEIIDALVGAPEGLDIWTDYSMVPGVPAVKITTTVRHPDGEGADLNAPLLGDLLAFGSQLTLFTETGGFVEPDSGKLNTIAGRGDGVSYAYVREDGDFTLPIVDSSFTGAFFDGGIASEGLHELQFSRWMIAGTGDIASALEVAHAIRGIEVVQIQGFVRELLTEDPIPDARVTVLSIGDGRHAINQAATEENGHYRLTVPPGTYEIIATAPGRRDTIQSEIPYDESLHLDLEMGTSGSLVVSTNGPAKITLENVNAEPFDPQLGVEHVEETRQKIYSPDGETTFTVKPGTYLATLSRGPEWSTHSETLDISEAEETILAIDLVHEVDTTGWLAGDFHQHTIGSLDSGMTHRDKVAENLAEGVEVPVTTDHDNVTDYRPAALEMGVEDLLHPMVGNEISVNSVGHFNAYPLPLDTEDPFLFVGSQFWAGRTIQELFDQVHEAAPESVIQINHPRDKGNAYFTWIGLDPVTGEATNPGEVIPDGFHGMEVNSDLGTPDQFTEESDTSMSLAAKGGQVPSMRDWFGLLGAGLPICAMGNSDSHDYGSKTGYPRTLLHVETDDPSAVTDSQVVNAIKGQRASISKGLFALFLVDDAVRMGHADPLTLDAEGSVSFDVVVRGPSWLGLNRVELYVNGRPMPLIDDPDNHALTIGGEGDLWVNSTITEGPFEWRRTVTMAPTEDTWIVVIARGAGSGEPVFSGEAFGYTNPLYIDVP